ncbi:MAG: alpha/beta hydrolase [Opitutus sp.]|nr:alpha/beta hydrolase [Opitutus sp.]
MREPVSLLTVPGYTNAGPHHWMSRWEADEPRFRRVQQRDWDHPTRAEWTAALADAAAVESRPPVLVAHSLGCIAIAHLAAAGERRVAAAFLVAPADVEQANLSALRDFAPVPLARFAFPVCVVASPDDPYLGIGRAKEFAIAWGAEFHAVAPCGHINSDSNLGSWATGRALLDNFLHRHRIE